MIHEKELTVGTRLGAHGRNRLAAERHEKELPGGGTHDGGNRVESHGSGTRDGAGRRPDTEPEMD